MFLNQETESRILIQDFKVQVLSEYEEYKPHLLRLFAKSEDTEETDYELKSIEDEMDKALKKIQRFMLDYDRQKHGNF